MALRRRRLDGVNRRGGKSPSRRPPESAARGGSLSARSENAFLISGSYSLVVMTYERPGRAKNWANACWADRPVASSLSHFVTGLPL